MVGSLELERPGGQTTPDRQEFALRRTGDAPRQGALPTVAHLHRSFAQPSETFIYTQMVHQVHHRAVVVTRDIRNPEHFPGVEVLAFSDHARGWRRRAADLFYRYTRAMSPYERTFFVRAMSALRPSVVHVHYAVEASYFAALHRRCGLPTVVSCYGYDVSSFPRRYGGLGRRYLQTAWRSADVYLAMSEDMRRDMIDLGCPPERIKVHYHGINLQRFPYVDRQRSGRPVRILFVGRLGDERKGVEYVIRAFARVAQERPDAELRLVGEGRFRQDYERLTRLLDVASRVSFAGFVPHARLHHEYAEGDIFCHPSVTSAMGDKEGIPGTLVEAMATGLPVVSTRHAGIPEVVADGEHGFLVAERDLDGLTRSLRLLLDDASLRLRMGTAAADRARECGDAVRQTAALEAIYDEVSASRERRAETRTPEP